MKVLIRSLLTGLAIVLPLIITLELLRGLLLLILSGGLGSNKAPGHHHEQ
ncbi:hypothetical protein ORJ00_07475 [Rheinheimera baltica]|nr:hypothetical protein [Rheinheimera baltica]MDP5142579.1 hypothetical protein [Rheinheimera baltica]MDP5150453.1 hypothetical protein [Rheinheimera baltica]